MIRCYKLKRVILLTDDSSPDINSDDSSHDEDAEKFKTDSSQGTTSKKIQGLHSGEQLEFSFEAYNEDIFICGSKNSGKSYLANTLMKSLNGVSVWVYDFNSQFHSSRAMVFHDLSEMLKVYDGAKRGHYILQPHINDENTFRRFCSEGFKRGNLVLIMDEIHTWLTKQKQNKEFNTIILSGRPRGISCVSISSRPASCPNHVLSNTKHVFAFKLKKNFLNTLSFIETWIKLKELLEKFETKMVHLCRVQVQKV
jgi:adenylate kinase family enzyme